ncbi:TonB-dependent receptor [Winogradskyella maritima]|nr:TonB-dependent receptor [Winogradskyella maritima]
MYLEASGRYDGHYSFGPDNRWGYFPAFSAAWRVSEEDFMQESIVNNLKLRGSWGKSGNLPYINGELAAFQYLAGYDLRGNAYAFGNGALVQGSRVQNEANPNITWEISTKLDVGLI